MFMATLKITQNILDSNELRTKRAVWDVALIWWCGWGISEEFEGGTGEG
jgi:hypothetical protein